MLVSSVRKSAEPPKKLFQFLPTSTNKNGVVFTTPFLFADGGTGTPAACSIRTWNARVYHSTTSAFLLVSSYSIINTWIWNSMHSVVDVLSRRTLSENLTFSQLFLRQSTTSAFLLVYLCLIIKSAVQTHKPPTTQFYHKKIKKGNDALCSLFKHDDFS